MTLTDYVIMPGADYQAACDKLREKSGKTGLIKSGDLASEIEAVAVGAASPLKIHQSLDAPFSSVSFIGAIDFSQGGDIVNILESRTVLVSGIYENDTTFGQLCVDKIIEHLTAYGFTAEPRGTETAILWNGKPRFVLDASSSTTGASVRVAGPWSADASWGTSYEVFKISSASSGVQTGTFTFKFFAIGDVAFFDLPVSSTDQSCASLPCQTIQGTESVVLVRAGGEMVVPLFAETIDNTGKGEWHIGGFVAEGGMPADPELCLVSCGMAISQSSTMHGFSDSVASVKTNTSITAGQVFTINGETYVSFHGSYCARVSAA